MSTPDKWAIIETKGEDLKLNRKVLASWYGGYTGSDSWKISSGIVEVIDKGNYFDFVNHSGSVYSCNKHSYGTSGYVESVYNGFVKAIEETDTDYSLRMLTEEEVLNEYKLWTVET